METVLNKSAINILVNDGVPACGPNAYMSKYVQCLRTSFVNVNYNIKFFSVLLWYSDIILTKRERIKGQNRIRKPL